MITLYQFPRLFGVPNMSHFCLKMETWLRMAGMQYVVKEVVDPRKAPKGKLPYIQDDTNIMADTSLIIPFLSDRHGVMLDGQLSPQERAVAHSMVKMIDEHLYWAVLYNRWVDENWPKVRDVFFSTLPPLIRSVVPAMIQKKMLSDIQSQGIGRHSKTEIYQLANQDIKALSDFLGDKSYFMGAQPTSLDASAFAILSNILEPPLRSPLKDYARKLPNLVAYNRRMGERYFPDFYLSEEV